MLTAQGIVKRRGRRRILDGLDLDLPAGSCTIVTGVNGSGKSTLLKVVAGLTRIDAGKVLGRPRRVGYVPERYRPPSAMTAASYLAHLGRMKGMPASKIRLRIQELADVLAVSPGIAAHMSALSKGNLQKIGLIQAFLSAESLVVLDEPSTGLDEQSVAVLDRLIRETCSRGAAVLMSDHLPSVEDSAERRCELRDGVLHWRSRQADARAVVITLRAVHDTALHVEVGHCLTSLDDFTVVVRAAAPDCDRTLVSAIEQGWSVVEVRNVRAETAEAESC